MDDVEKAVKKARTIAGYSGDSRKTYRRAGKEIGAAIDAANKGAESAREKDYHGEVSEITKYHTKRAEKQTKHFIIRG